MTKMLQLSKKYLLIAIILGKSPTKVIKRNRGAPMKYRPDIDGLRAASVILVLLFHVGLPLIPGGYVGVDVFFVISGFVISIHLIDEINKKQFSVADFYTRRIKRIIPAQVFVLIITTIAAYKLFLPPQLLDYSRTLGATALSAANIYFAFNSGYFENGANLRPLLHMWSLGVEEQFYVFLPIGLLLISRYLKSNWKLTLVPVTILSFLFCVYASYSAARFNFFMLPTRAWELLLGVLLVLIPLPDGSRIIRQIAGVAGLAMIFIAAITFTEETRFPGVSALMPCVGAALLIWSGRLADTGVSSLLSLRPLVFIGLISYSLYLVHWPIIVFTHYYTLQPTTYPMMALMIAASFVTAVFSWRFIEQPFRKPGVGHSRLRLFGATAAVTAVILVVAASGTLTNGLPGRFPDFQVAGIPSARKIADQRCLLESNVKPEAWKAEDCVLAPGHGDGTVILWGDSFAGHYAPGIRAFADKIPFRVVQYTAAGCRPVLSFFSHALPNCQNFNSRILDVARRENAKIIIMVGRWTNARQITAEQVAGTVRALTDAGFKVYLVGQSPEFVLDVPSLDYRINGKPNGPVTAWLPAISKEVNPRMAEAVGESRFIDPLAVLCPDGKCQFRQGKDYLFSDFGHFSELGSSNAVQAFLPLLFTQQGASR